MPTVAITKTTRWKLGFIKNGNENFGDAIDRLIDEEVKRKKLDIPAEQ